MLPVFDVVSYYLKNGCVKHVSYFMIKHLHVYWCVLVYEKDKSSDSI